MPNLETLHVIDKFVVTVKVGKHREFLAGIYRPGHKETFWLSAKGGLRVEINGTVFDAHRGQEPPEDMLRAMKEALEQRLSGQGQPAPM